MDDAIASNARSGAAFSDVADGDLWLAAGNYTAGTVHGGVIRKATAIHVDWTYTQGTNPTDRAIGTAFNVDWDTTITAGGGFGPQSATSHFGPRSVYHLEGILKYGVDATPYGFSPIPFGNTLLVKNTPGVARKLVPSWGFMEAGIHVADAATVTADITDVSAGGASFADSRVIATVASGTWNGTTNSTELQGFTSMPFVVGNSSISKRIAFEVMDINGTVGTDYNAVRGAVAAITGKTADAGMGTVATQYGLRIPRLANATRNIGISNASATLNVPAAKTITAASDTIPIDATQVYLNNTSGGPITLTSTPILADGVDGQTIDIVNVGTQTVILAGETDGGGSTATANTNVHQRISLASGGKVTLRWSASTSQWRKHTQLDPLVDMGTSTVNIYAAFGERYPKVGFGSVFGAAYFAFGAGGSTDIDTVFRRTAAGTLTLGAGILNSGDGMLQAGTYRVMNNQTGTSYSVVLADQAKHITRNNAGASTQVWPKDSSQAIPIGAIIETVNLGAGTVTHSADTGASLTTGSATSQPQGKRMTAIKVAANTWSLTVSA